MAFYFLRHGESVSNVKRLFDGQGLNAELTSLGEKQAAEAAKELTGLNINKIYSSPLKRARKTAEIVAGAIRYPLDKITYDDRIMEHDWGSLSGHSWDIDDDTRERLVTDAESNLEFQERIISFLREVKDSRDNILIVCHGGVGSMIEASRRNVDVNAYYEVVSYPNAHIVQLDLAWLR